MPSTEAARSFGTRYELREVIARGGMGDVHAAWDRGMDRPVAIKLLRPDLAHLPGMRARVEVEARAAAKLSHPNVVKVFDAGTVDGRPFIAMELLEGRTLADEIASGPLPEERVREVGEQVLAALGAAHAAGVLHRDVKPGNVLAADDRRWKVADFGIAKSTQGEVTITRTGELLGSPSYLAPERLTGSPASPASDLYSVGVLLYEALSGRRPFEGTDAWSVALKIREGGFAPLRSVRADADPELCGVIERAMATDPRDRFGSAEVMAEALRRPTNGEPTIPVPIEATRDLTAPVPSGEATEIIKREATAVLEVPRPDVTPVSPPAGTPRTARTKRVRSRSSRPAGILGAVAAALVAIGLVLALAFFVGDRPASPDSTTPPRVANTIPPELDRALDRLRDAVRP